MCLMDRINQHRKKIRDNSGYTQAPLIGNKQEFSVWKERVLKRVQFPGRFIVIPETMNESIEIYCAVVKNDMIFFEKGNE